MHIAKMNEQIVSTVTMHNASMEANPVECLNYFIASEKPRSNSVQPFITHLVKAKVNSY